MSDILNITKETARTKNPYITEIKTGKKRRIYFQKEIYDYISKKEEEKIFNVSRQSVWKTFKKIAKENGITKNIGTHTMRRTFSNIYVRKNGIYKLKKVLNHNYLSETLFYTIPNEMIDKTPPKKGV